MGSKRYLVDTSVFIWLMGKDKRIKPQLYSLLGNPKIEVFISVVSIWEIVLKRKKTPLKVPRDIIKGIESVNFQILPIEASHVIKTENLPAIHKDPFDRMLVAQAIAEKLTIITQDEKIKKYDVKIFS